MIVPLELTISARFNLELRAESEAPEAARRIIDLPKLQLVEFLFNAATLHVVSHHYTGAEKTWSPDKLAVES